MYKKAIFDKYRIGGAVVEMDISESENLQIIMSVNGVNESHSQGYIIHVPTDDTYTDWKEGAEIGVKYALKKMNLTKFCVTISSIQGLDTDTNPTIVALTSIKGIYDFFNHELDEAQLEEFINYGRQSWQKDYKYIPIELLASNFLF